MSKATEGMPAIMGSRAGLDSSWEVGGDRAKDALFVIYAPVLLFLIFICFACYCK